MESEATWTDDFPSHHLPEKRALPVAYSNSGDEVNQMHKLSTLVQVVADSLLTREEGQTMAEYGVVLAVIVIAVIGAITLLAGNVSNSLNAVAGVLP
jgi:Flp pilus assembly pilin Flp